MEDGRCKLGLLGRLELVRLIERGATLRAAAAALSVAPATAPRGWHRGRAARGGGGWVGAPGAGCHGRRAGVAVVSADAVLAAAVVPVGVERRCGAGDPRC